MAPTQEFPRTIPERPDTPQRKLAIEHVLLKQRVTHRQQEEVPDKQFDRSDREQDSG